MSTEALEMDLLDLDEASLPSEALSVAALMRELNLQKKPSWILTKLMNALEQKRQKKGLGWSRAWNKQGLTVFRTHVQSLIEDADYFEPLLPLLNHFLTAAPTHYRDFVVDLLDDPSGMAFTFYHNNTTETGRQYEGLTVSLGRKVPADQTKRDRLDIVLEDEREGGRVDGKADRLRLYVCPWEIYQERRAFHLCERTEMTEAERTLVQESYQRCVAKYHAWKEDQTRQWSHWSVRYIDYFGPRNFIPRGSSFV